jgi:8-oxo-dGTP pyrophosphatase MutT (NUDIX family)
MNLRVRERRVARVVVVDSEDRVLLFDTHLAYTRVWMTPGGALNAAETYEQAAVRELWEETGLYTDSLSPCIWMVRFRFEYRGQVYDQHERYFLVRVPSAEISATNREPAELSEIREHRWWTVTDIRSSPASFRPRNLAALLPPVLAGFYPAAPSSAEVESTAQVL